MTERGDEESRYRPSGEVLDLDPRHFWNPAHTLPLSLHYALGIFGSADGTYRCMSTRSAYPQVTRSFSMVESFEPGEDFVRLPAADSAYAGRVHTGKRDGQWGLRRPDGADLLTCSEGGMRWEEGDLLRVAGAAVAAAARIRVAEGDPPLVYTVRGHRATGSIRGRPVEGAILQASVHMPEGVDYFASAYGARLQVAWAGFVNELEDGTIETGDLIWGDEGFAIMLVQGSGRAPLVATDVEVEIENDAGTPEFPQRIRYAGGGQAWEWNALPAGGRLPVRERMEGAHRYRQGTVRCENDSRTVVSSLAFIESFQARMRPRAAPPGRAWGRKERPELPGAR